MATRGYLVLSGALLFSVVSVPAFSQCTGHAALNDYEVSGFISLAWGGKAEVAAQFLVTDGCNVVILESLKQLGANVRFTDANIGYVLVMLPKARLLDALDLPGIAYAFPEGVGSAYLYSARDDAYVPPSERKLEPLPPIVIPIPRVGRSLPQQDGPYFAAAEAGLTALWPQ